MPFKPNLDIIKVEVSLSKLLRFLEKSQGIETQKISAKQTNNSDINNPNELVINFYTQIIALLNSKIKKKPEQWVEQKKQIDELLPQISDSLLHLKKDHFELWEYLFQSSTGRRAIYYYIYIVITHNDYCCLHESINEFINTLSEYCSDQAERNILIYLRFRLNLLVANKKEKSRFIINDKVANPYITSYYAFSNLMDDTESLENKLSHLEKLTQNPLEFPNNIPNFIIQFIKIECSYLLIMGVAAHFEHIPQFKALGEKLARLGYVLEDKENTRVQEQNYMLQKVAQLSYYITEVREIYALFNFRELLFTDWRISLLHCHIHLYEHTRAHMKIDAQDHLLLAHSCITIIQSSFIPSPQKAPYFWRTVADIFSPKILVSVEFIQLMTRHIDWLITILSQQDLLQGVIDVLATAIEFNLKAEETKYYMSLLNALQLIRSIPNEGMNKNDFAKEFYAFITSLKETKLNTDELNYFNLNNKLVQFRLNIKLLVLKRFTFIKDQLTLQQYSQSDLLPFYKLIYLLCSILKADDLELNNLAKAFGYNDKLHFELVEFPEKDSTLRSSSKNSSKQKLIKSLQIFSPEPSPASSSSFFTPEKTPRVVEAHKIERNKLPQSLLSFAQWIKELTQKDLILTGGAVVHLYLDRPNPNDYDCLALDFDREALFNEMKKAGFNCVMVGKKHPVIKLKLTEGNRLIEVDLTTAVQGNVPLTKAMADILAYRDYRLSALYMCLTPCIPTFEVKGCDYALRSVNNKLISAVRNRDSLFDEDFIRLFRLVKISLQFPDFKIDDVLALILKKTNMNHCFQRFLSPKLPQEDLNQHQGQIATSIESLFARFDMNRVITALHSLGAFNAITGLDYSEIEPTLSALLPFQQSDAYTQKLAFYYFIYIHFCMHNPEPSVLEQWPFYKVARCVKPIDRLNFDFIEHTVLHVEKNVFVKNQPLIEMIDAIKVFYIKPSVPHSTIK